MFAVHTKSAAAATQATAPMAIAAPEPLYIAAAYAAASAMNAGNAITSRESHDVRHIAAERHARSGRPRWKNDATRPSAASTTATPAPATAKRASACSAPA